MPSAPPGIELRHLRYFLAVMEELHFGRAARRLHIAQPPLSQAIMRLENELGVALLRRTSRVVAPTAAGTVFAEAARALLADLDVTVAETRRAGGAADPLRVGCVGELTMDRTQRFLEMVRRRRPDGSAEVTHLLAHEQVARLRDGDLEVGIFHAAEEHADVEVEPVFQGPALAALVPIGHPLASARAATPEDLRGQRIVMVAREVDEALYERMLQALADGGYELGAVRNLHGASVRDALVAVAQGVGVAVGPFEREHVREADALVARVPLDPAVHMPDAVMAWRADPWPRLGAIIGELRRGARELRRADGLR